jgi:hypothetical protein
MTTCSRKQFIRLATLEGLRARGAGDMACERTLTRTDWRKSARQFRSAFLLSAISTAVISCGGGGEEAASRDNTAVVAWDAVGDPNLAGYRIYYGTAPGTYLQPIGKGIEVDMSTTTYTVTELTSGTWYFVATAYDSRGGESSHSNEASKSLP